MRIVLIGYGKMGQLIEKTAAQKGHQVVACITSKNHHQLSFDLAQQADVAIEFTAPHAAFENIKRCIDIGIPVVSGTTGWNDGLAAVKAYCIEKKGSFLHASNFSIGVNVFFEINKHLAKLMSHQPQYDVTIKEIHHTQKKDAPSGTAVTLADQILERIERKKSWTVEEDHSSEQLLISSERTDPAPGTHHVVYTSAIDDIELIHTAHNREGFASGAIIAAEYVYNKKGIFSMADVLQL